MLMEARPCAGELRGKTESDEPLSTRGGLHVMAVRGEGFVLVFVTTCYCYAVYSMLNVHENLLFGLSSDLPQQTH